MSASSTLSNDENCTVKIELFVSLCDSCQMKTFFVLGKNMAKLGEMFKDTGLDSTTWNLLRLHLKDGASYFDSYHWLVCPVLEPGFWHFSHYRWIVFGLFGFGFLCKHRGGAKQQFVSHMKWTPCCINKDLNLMTELINTLGKCFTEALDQVRTGVFSHGLRKNLTSSGAAPCWPMGRTQASQCKRRG